MGSCQKYLYQWYQWPVMVPRSLMQDVLRAYVDNRDILDMIRHSALLENYVWETMRKNIHHYMKDYQSCMRSKADYQLPSRAMFSDKANETRDITAIDLIGPLPAVREHYAYVWICMDIFTLCGVPLRQLSSELRNPSSCIWEYLGRSSVIMVHVSFEGVHGWVEEVSRRSPSLPSGQCTSRN